MQKSWFSKKNCLQISSAVNDCLLSMQAYPGDPALRDQFLNQVARASQDHNKNYIKTIQSLDPESKQMGSDWLQGIVDQTLAKVLEILPSYR